jgi:molybdopterin converting factor small subunit
MRSSVKPVSDGCARVRKRVSIASMNPRKRLREEDKPIRVTLKVFGGLRQLRESATEERNVPAASTIEGLWVELALEAPEFVEKLRDGVSKGYLHVLLNGRNVVFLDGPRTQLNDGDTVAILPPIGGG